jgi:hypothetical protein
MRLRFAAAAALCVVSIPAFAKGPWIDDFRIATPEELALKSIAFAPGVSAVMLDWVRANDDAEFEHSEYVRIKVLTGDGKKYGDIEVPYLPFYSNFDFIQARVTKPDGTIVPFSGKILDKLLVKVGGLRVSAKTFSLPDVQPGSIIEYRYRMNVPRFVESSNFIVQREVPVLHEIVWLRPYDRTYASFFTYGGLPRGKKPEKVGDHYELTLADVPPFEEEPYSPPEREIKPFTSFFYTLGETEPEPFWKRQSELWAESIEGFIGNLRSRGAIQKEADAAIAGAQTPLEKVQRLYLRAQQVRNLAYEHQRTEAEEKKLRSNSNIDDVLRNGYGYSAEINRLFIGLARAAGFVAHAVRIGERNDHFLAKNLPIGDQLDGEVSVVAVEGKEVYVDPGTPYAPFGLLAWQKTKVPGLRIEKKMPPTWIMTPETLPEDAVIVRRAVLNLEEGMIKGTVTVTYDGLEALGQRLLYHDEDEGAVTKAFEAMAKEWFPEGSSVKVTSVVGLKTAGKPVTAQMEVEITSLGAFTGARALVPLSVFAASAKNPFAAEKRKYVIYLPHPSLTEDDVVMQVPAGYSVESMPQPSRIDSGALVYESRTVREGDRTLHFTRKLEVKSFFFEPHAYPQIRKFYGKVTAADQDQVILRKAAAQ